MVTEQFDQDITTEETVTGNVQKLIIDSRNENTDGMELVESLLMLRKHVNTETDTLPLGAPK